jgi:membrane protein
MAYHYLPCRACRSRGWETLAGAVVATALWAAATLLFRIFLASFGRLTRTYGALSAVIVLLIWTFLTSFAVLIGAELAAVLERRGRRRERRAGWGVRGAATEA